MSRNANYEATRSTAEKQSSSTATASNPGQQIQSMLESGIACARDFAREKPDAALLWAFGIGFVLGWKLKPW